MGTSYIGRTRLQRVATRGGRISSSRHGRARGPLSLPYPRSPSPAGPAMRFLCFAPLFLVAAAVAADPPKSKKVVLIAGPLDAGHPVGTHEYEKTVRAFKYCLENASNVRGMRVEAHLTGWPDKPATLDDADTIVLVSSGSDRKED